ncbi:MAG TPA: hypothetical protein VFW21_08735 [Mycobacterium sp.]|nr:hypothetical protein [Mycobacterium sp.]
MLGNELGWLHAEVVLDGKTVTGYVSHELVRYAGLVVAPSAPASVAPPMLTLNLGLRAPDAAFVTLKRAENRRVAMPTWRPSADEARDLNLAADTLERTNHYTVDRATFVVSFAPQTGAGGVLVDTIEDFILFVETVERQYPLATPREIAGEIRQLWFGGANWEALLNSPGVTVGRAAVDIEHAPNPIATKFNIPALKSTGHKLKTKFGDVDISHVIAGIDAALSGAALAPSDDSDASLKHKTLNTADAGDPRDFATWSGDIGQAYAEYLVARYVDGKAHVKLQQFVDAKASPEQLLGDIHGYIATQVWRNTPPNVGTGWWTAGQSGTVSEILRALYLVDKSGTAGAGSYQHFAEQVSGRLGADLRSFVTTRSLAFARPWYAKAAISSRGRIGSVVHDPSLSSAGILSGLLHEFDDKHAENERMAAEEDKVEAVIDRFLPMLGGSVQ